MRSYLIDELSPHDVGRITEYLARKGGPSELEGMFWMPMPTRLLTGIQLRHGPCHPLVFAVEVGRGWVKMEFFVRTRHALRCACQDYATPEQVNFIVDFANRMIEELEIKT